MSSSDIQEAVRLALPGGRLVRSEPLTGGVSAQVLKLEVSLPGGESQTAVLKQHCERDLSQNPNVARLEHDLLVRAKAGYIPAPTPLAAGQGWLLMEYVTGEPHRTEDDAPERLAQILSRIHALRTAARPAHLPEQSIRTARLLAAAREPEWQFLAEPLRRTPAPYAEPAVLHGDFWPGNVLWRDGQIAAVIDWEDAAAGDPMVDVANAQLEMILNAGEEAGDRFIAAYPSPSASLPWWQAYSALRLGRAVRLWGLDESRAQAMTEQIEAFGRNAIAELG